MLPDARPFTATDAERWLRAGVPRWVTRVALPALWTLAVVVAVAADTTRCTPQDPSACGPDSTFAFAFVALLATPVLLFWMPILGCLTGVGFAVADLRYDDVQGARWAFGLHGLLCALVAVWLVRGMAEQRRIASAAGGGRRVTGLAGPAAEAVPRAVPRLLVAGALVLAGLGFFAWYGHQVAGEQAHLRRAVRAQGRIVAVRPDESITVSVRTPSAGTREYRVGVYDYTDPYPLHSTTPVLLDAQDPGWIRLLAEPRDSTGWQSAGAGCFALAFCLLLHGARWRRGMRALGSDDQLALRVRIRPDADGHALILPAVDGEPGPAAERPFGRMAVIAAPQGRHPDDGRPDDQHPDDGRPDDRCPGDQRWAADEWDDDEWDDEWEEGWDYETQAAFGRSWRGEEAPDERLLPPPDVVEDAVWIGGLHDRGIAMLVTADAVLLPRGRLRAGRISDPPRLLRRWRSATRPAEPELFAGQPVSSETLRQPPELPFTARPPARTRAVGALLLLAGFVGYPVTVRLAGLDGVGLALGAVAFGRLVKAGAARLFSYLRLSHHQFEIAGSWRTYSVPWDRLHGVRRDGAVLSVAWQPDIVIDVGPFDDPAGERGRRDRAEQLGAAMLLHRQRALLGGLPGRKVRSRPSATWPVLALYAAMVVATILLR